MFILEIFPFLKTILVLNLETGLFPFLKLREISTKTTFQIIKLQKTPWQV
jgi:hypothetical protein